MKQAEFEKQRFIAKTEKIRAVEAIQNSLEYEIKKIKEEAQEKIKRLETASKERILHEELRMRDRLKEIAIEEDNFMDEIRNYAETLQQEEE